MPRPGIEPHLTDISGAPKQLLEKRNLSRSLRHELGVQAESDPDELARFGKFCVSRKRLRGRRYRQSRCASSIAGRYRRPQIRV